MFVDVALYPYRVYVSGGHVFKAYSPFRDPVAFWENIKKLQETNEDFYAVTFGSARQIISICFDSKAIQGYDTAFIVQDTPMIIELRDGKQEAIPYIKRNQKEKVKPIQKVNLGKKVKSKNG